MSEKVRWGILGCGNIAVKFATGLASSPDSTLAATGSRTLAKAEEFAASHGAERAYGSYHELASDPAVDAIYVATPHPMHHGHTILCLRNGKAVLCEKPFAINTRQASEMIAVAREERRFLMEAMWSRFLPSIQRVKQLVEDGAIGDLRMLQADFGFRAQHDPQSRLFDPNLGGGGLLDVGIYPVSLASYLFDVQPNQIATIAEVGSTQVDEQAAMVFGYPNGEIAVLATGVRTTTPHEATVMGTEGYIRLHAPWWRGAAGFTIHRPGGEPEFIDNSLVGNGYNYEADEVCRCLSAGMLESNIMPLTESLEIMGTLDRIRDEWNLTYPMEGNE